MTSILLNGGDTLNIFENTPASLKYNINGLGETSITALPITITRGTGTELIKVLLTTDITITSAITGNVQGLITIGASTPDVQIGNEDITQPQRVIQINSLSGQYLGTIANGSTSVNGNNNVSVYSLNIRINTSTAASSLAGWVCKAAFARGAQNNLVSNCTVSSTTAGTGGTSGQAGGIVGAQAARNGGNLTVINCRNIALADIGGINSGGIMGAFAGADNTGANLGTVLVKYCYTSNEVHSSKALANNNGGIFGGSASSGCTAEYCFTNININAAAAGGIFGPSSNGTARNCYSLGNIVGTTGAGGIFGGSATASATAINCYSQGNISGPNAGGIFGASANAAATATNCYSSGLISGAGAGGIFGGTTTIPTGCYVADGSWSDNPAKSALIGVPSGPYDVGTVWFQPNGSGTEFEFVSGVQPSPYSVDNTNPIPKTIPENTGDTYSPILELASGYTFSFYSINNSDPLNPLFAPYITIIPLTGEITVASNTPGGIYTVLVFSTKNPYTLTTFNITVEGEPAPPPPEPTAIIFDSVPIPPCCLPNVCNANPQATNYNSDIITNKKGGKAVDRSVDDFYFGVASGQRTAHSQPIFKSYHDYMVYLQGKYK